MASKFKLRQHQLDALKLIKSGSILNGGVGSGKTITSLMFYKNNFSDKVLIVITTAKKRDSGDWEDDASKIGVKIEKVDSWNNITNYLHLTNAFFIFDEQRAIGYSTWGKAFIKIAKRNKWVLLTATPGDTWMDYMTVFIANGFYRNKTDFVEQHVEYDQYAKFPKIKKYHNEGRLDYLRRYILVPMNFERTTTRIKKYINSDFNRDDYGKTIKGRWNIFEDKPIENASEMTQCVRKVVAMNEDRIINAKILIDIHDKIIVFYNYDYERDILIQICKDLGRNYSEWNGHNHDEVPKTVKWIYLVQYTAGAEGWNCITTNVILFYSLNYSYKIAEQSEGRIDRLNTKFTDLHYYYLVSDSPIDKGILRTLEAKKNFNESAWLRKGGISFP